MRAWDLRGLGLELTAEPAVEDVEQAHPIHGHCIMPLYCADIKAVQ